MKIYLIVLVCLFSFPANGQTISTFAGNGIRVNTGDGGSAATAAMNYPAGLASDKQGNIYISLGFGGNGVRKINSAGIISRIVGTGASGYSGDGGLATNAALKLVSQVALDTAGNIYVADAGNYVIRRIDAITNIITTVAGTGVAGFSGDGGPATAAQLNGSGSLCLDGSGNLYISDICRVRKVNNSGIISTVAGTGVAGYSGDNRFAATSQIYSALGITTDVSGNLYIADGYSGVRKVSLAGVITTVVGNGISGSSGDGGLATSAQTVPTRVKFDKFGNMYITEYPVGNKVRMVNKAGIITTIAGQRNYRV